MCNIQTKVGISDVESTDMDNDSETSLVKKRDKDDNDNDNDNDIENDNNDNNEMNYNNKDNIAPKRKQHNTKNKKILGSLKPLSPVLEKHAKQIKILKFNESQMADDGGVDVGVAVGGGSDSEINKPNKMVFTPSAGMVSNASIGGVTPLAKFSPVTPDS